MKTTLIFTLLLTLHVNMLKAQQCPIVPKPVEYTANPGYFYFKPTSYILVNDMASFMDAVTFRDMSIKFHSLPLKTVREEIYPSHYIEVSYDSTLMIPDGGYTMLITEEKITIIGKNKGGVFYGLMSLLQMTESKFTNQFQVPCASISDFPQFQYRGMHLDCSRHFFTVDEVKMYIDYLALYKMNTFHWHLTDDQGWRIEIKQYPKLTSVGAYRTGTMKGHYRDQQYDTINYGGYYTQKEISEVVKYAKNRNITIIPEIEMPGHCAAALAAYPELGCIADTTYSVGQAWGVYKEAFCPKPETFEFLYRVLDEVMALFPSQYIHIGGDEVEKDQWMHCDYCQQLIKEKNLVDEHGLQGYFTKTIAEYVQSKGRNIIGWDEILTNDLPQQAAIMSWRGVNGGIDAARAGHYAVMTPGSHCYFDYYQGLPYQEPLAIGGYIPLQKVYEYHPIPDALTPEESKYILGAQGNLWTEYIPNFDQVEYMVIPRMLALSEVLWTPDTARNYADFMRRLSTQFELLGRVDCHYSKSAFGIIPEVLPTDDFNGVRIALRTWDNTTGFEYQYEDTSKNSPAVFGGAFSKGIYTAPFIVNESYSLIIPEDYKHPEVKLRLLFNKATGKKITLKTPPAQQYSGSGAFSLVDGINASLYPSWSGNEWLGFSGTNLNCTIDLGAVDTIMAVSAGFLEDKTSWIYLPSSMEISVSLDGKKFTRIGIVPVVKDDRVITNGIYKFDPTAARYVRIIANNIGTIPQGNPGAGNKAWLFVDEVHIR